MNGTKLVQNTKHILRLVNYYKKKVECRPMPKVMLDLPNLGEKPQSLADAHH